MENWRIFRDARELVSSAVAKGIIFRLEDAKAVVQSAILRGVASIPEPEPAPLPRPKGRKPRVYKPAPPKFKPCLSCQTEFRVLGTAKRCKPCRAKKLKPKARKQKKLKVRLRKKRKPRLRKKPKLRLRKKRKPQVRKKPKLRVRKKRKPQVRKPRIRKKKTPKLRKPREKKPREKKPRVYKPAPPKFKPCRFCGKRFRARGALKSCPACEERRLALYVVTPDTGHHCKRCGTEFTRNCNRQKYCSGVCESRSAGDRKRAKKRKIRNELKINPC